MITNLLGEYAAYVPHPDDSKLHKLKLRRMVSSSEFEKSLGGARKFGTALKRYNELMRNIMKKLDMKEV